MTDKLKPCPFRQCGGEGSHPFTVGDKWVVECSRCDCAMEPKPTKAEAIAYWNDREDGAATVLIKKTSRHKVGDRVQHRDEPGMPGRVCELPDLYMVEWPDEGRQLHEGSDLEPAPDPLPEGHIDRFWRVGAWITLCGLTWVVVSEDVAIEIGPTPDAPALINRKHFTRGGYSYHYLSPIQEEVDIDP